MTLRANLILSSIQTTLNFVSHSFFFVSHSFFFPEKYKDYFTTPYFIFFRDTLSYLSLLGLHFAICLSPSTITFSGLEWVILIFLLGRIFMEADQLISAKKDRVKTCTPRRRNSDRLNNEECLPDNEPEENVARNSKISLKRFLSYFRYFSFDLPI